MSNVKSIEIGGLKRSHLLIHMWWVEVWLSIIQMFSLSRDFQGFSPFWPEPMTSTSVFKSFRYTWEITQHCILKVASKSSSFSSLFLKPVPNGIDRVKKSQKPRKMKGQNTTDEWMFISLIFVAVTIFDQLNFASRFKMSNCTISFPNSAQLFTYLPSLLSFNSWMRSKRVMFSSKSCVWLQIMLKV